MGLIKYFLSNEKRKKTIVYYEYISGLGIELHQERADDIILNQYRIFFQW